MESKRRRFRDFTGVRFSMLVGIKFSRRTKGKTFWFFKCDCGKETEVDIGKFYGIKQNKSCGCIKNKNLQEKILRDNGSNASQLYLAYKASAEKRGLEFGMDKRFFLEIIDMNCHYCGSAPFLRFGNKSNPKNTYMGIDRKDNDKGYIHSNLLPCCNICNRGKNNMSYEDFMSYIARLKSFESKDAVLILNK